MKTRIKSLVVMAVVMIAAFFTGDAAPLKPLNLEQTHSEVRVVLLRAGQMVSTNNQPEFVVTYIVEVPNKGAFSDLHFYSTNEIALAVRGKPFEFQGFSSSAMDFKDLPRQEELSRPGARDGKSMIAQDIVFQGLKVDSKKIDVKLQFTWRGNKMRFDFKDVPLN